jgi:hypothetical protein
MMRRLTYICLFLGILSPWFNLQAQLVFSTPESFPTGKEPFIANSADLNGDGMPDLVIPNREDATVSILFGDGQGRFSGSATMPTGRGPRYAVCADLDGDAILDIITTNRDSGDLTLLFGDGRGGFPRSSELPVSRGPQAVAIADLNGDGAPDLAVAGREARRILVYLNDGEGRFFKPAKLVVGKGPRWIIALDLNGDDIPDLATADRVDGTVSIRFGDGKGHFQEFLTLNAGRAPTMLVPADINQDDHLDLIVSDRTTNDLSLYGDAAPGMKMRGQVYIFAGDGKGDFATPVAWDTGGHPAGIAVADLNGDHVLDIAIANNAPDNLVVLIGNKQGAFSDPIVISSDVGRVTRSVLSVDINRDGRPDLLVTSRDSNAFYVLMNRTSQ